MIVCNGAPVDFTESASTLAVANCNVGEPAISGGWFYADRDLEVSERRQLDIGGPFGPDSQFRHRHGSRQYGAPTDRLRDLYDLTADH